MKKEDAEDKMILVMFFLLGLFIAFALRGCLLFPVRYVQEVEGYHFNVHTNVIILKAGDVTLQ